MIQQKDKINPITSFAVTNYRDIRKIFGIKEQDRRRHMYVIGKTGTGKTTLLQNMIISDIREGNGVGLVDPTGDLTATILHHVPQSRIQHVVYIDPSDKDYPIGFNPLHRVNPDIRPLVASGLISVFKKAWPEFWGPRLEHILRNALMALLEIPGSTLLDLPPMLVDKDFRKAVVVKLSDPVVRDFWIKEFEKYSAWLRSEATSPILNKVGQYLSTPLIRNILGQRKSAFRLREVMDSKKIFILNLSKGKIGEDNCSLLGSMFITMIQLAALSRCNVPEKDRIHFYLYVDEVHSFLTLSFADILSEARKYGLSLVLAHQYITQLDEKVRAAILGNVGTMISFRIGQEDAKLLAGEFYPVFNEEDLVNLPNYDIYLKLLIDGVASRPFSATTLPPCEPRESFKEEVINASRERYCRPRSEVEKEMANREMKLARISSSTRSPFQREQSSLF